MERLKRVVTQIAFTPDCRLSETPLLHRSLLPLLSLASSIYRFSLALRRRLYFSGLLHQRRLPVPVISVGNLTWGGNGKTPMVEFIARLLDEAGIGPLILTRGYSGGDEAKMLHRHLLQTSARIGVGANRIATAASMFERHGYVDSCDTLSENLSSPYKFESGPKDEKIGVVILDDGMQTFLLDAVICHRFVSPPLEPAKLPLQRHNQHLHSSLIWSCKHVSIVVCCMMWKLLC